MAWNQDYGEGANPGSTREQQSWRDSYNGGQAAGDWTGNTNARLDSERDRFQGATWSGSSSQPSALELARSFVGSGQSGGTNGRGPTGTGAGHEAVVPRKSSGGNLTFSGTGAGAGAVLVGPLKAKTKDTNTGLVLGGSWFQANPWWSDGADAEDRWGELGGSAAGLIVMGADAVWNVGRLANWSKANAHLLNGASPSAVNEPDPIYHDGWVSYDGRGTWERAPKGSPADQYWSF